MVDKKILEPMISPPPADVTDSRFEEPHKEPEVDGLLVTGVFDPSSGRHLTLAEAVRTGCVDLQTGTFINSVTGKRYPLAEAIRHGYLSVEQATGDTEDENVIALIALAADAPTGADLEELLEVSARRAGNPLPVDINHNAYDQLRAGVDVHRKSIVDPSSGRTVSIDEALNSGLLVLDPLGIVTADGTSIPLNEAAASDLVDTALLHDVLSSLQQMSLEQMVENGLIDADSGLYRDPDSGQMIAIGDAIAAGKLDPYKVFYADPSSGSILSLGTAIDLSLIHI